MAFVAAYLARLVDVVERSRRGSMLLEELGDIESNEIDVFVECRSSFGAFAIRYETNVKNAAPAKCAVECPDSDCWPYEAVKGADLDFGVTVQ